MKILLCNDDGYRALGINTLSRVLREAGHQTTIVAPHEERSGQSHAVSFFRPLAVQQEALDVYSVHGTPADCAIIGLRDILKNNPPDIVISGINHGLNVGWDVNYSGTVGAATEATMLGFRSIAVSVDTYLKPDETECFRMAAKLVASVLANLDAIAWPKFEVLNINHPGHAPKGVVSAQCGGYNLYVPALAKLSGSHPRTGDVYIIGGSDRMEVTAPNQDVTAIQQGYVTLSFVQSRQSSTVNTEKLSQLISKL